MTRQWPEWPYRLNDEDRCPVCGKPSTLDRNLDRYYHDDGTDNDPCWLVILRGDQPKSYNYDNDDEQRSAVDRRYLELHELIVDVEGLRKIEPPSPLVDGYLYHDSLAWLGGKPGHGKTFAAVDLACCVGTGTPWHGREVVQGAVLYLIAEGAAGLAQRVDAWILANGKQVRNVLFLPVPVQLMSYVDVSAFTQLVLNLTVDLVIIDTQARVTVGAEENSSKDMGRFVDYLEQVRRHTSACVLVVHHEPRNGENLRGSTALEGAATTILRAAKDGNVVELTNPKQKDTPEQPPMLLALSPVDKSRSCPTRPWESPVSRPNPSTTF